jgi:hypothetical protein
LIRQIVPMIKKKTRILANIGHLCETDNVILIFCLD